MYVKEIRNIRVKRSFSSFIYFFFIRINSWIFNRELNSYGVRSVDVVVVRWEKRPSRENGEFSRRARRLELDLETGPSGIVSRRI